MNTRFLSIGVLGMVLCLPARGTAAGAVALSDETAECRSLLSLCQPAEVALRKLQAVTRQRERSEHVPPESRTPASLEALSKLQTQEKAARNDFNTRLQQSLEAATALRAKHAEVPACFQQCPHVLGSALKAWQ
jgi:hypothetical protein